jgi:formylmethanofuran dehydrogenase subunit C
MGLFEKLLSLKSMAPYLNMTDESFIEEKGWRNLILSIKQFKDPELVRAIVERSTPSNEKEKIIRGFLTTVCCYFHEGEFTCMAVDYAGCFMEKGLLRLKNESREYFPNYIGMGMASSSPNCKIIIDGNVGDYLGYRSKKLNIEIHGDVRDRVAMGVGEGYLLVTGNVAGGIGGDSSCLTVEVEGSVGRINSNNSSSRFLINEDVQWGIGENLSDCFIKINGNVGIKYMKTKKLFPIAPRLTKNSLLIVGGDVCGHLGKEMENAKIFVWGKVHGEVNIPDTGGGFVYLNKKNVPIKKRFLGGLGKSIGLKYVNLKESAYLFIEKEEDIKELIL